MNTPGVITQPTAVTVNLVVDTTSGGDTGSYGGLISIWFDTTKVQVSDAVANVTGYDMDCDFWDNATGTQNYICTGLTEITATCSFLTFTVTPVGASADLSDCSVIRLTPGSFYVWPSSQLISLAYDTVYATGSCVETDGATDTDTATDDTTGTGNDSSDEANDEEAPNGGQTDSGMSAIIESVKRILRYAAGLATEPGRLTWPYTETDAATLELTDTNFTMMASPANACDIPTARQLTIADAVLFLKLATETQGNATWTMDFFGNPQLGGNAANATGMPTIADIDGDGKLDAVFLMGMINGTNYYDPRYTGNPNQVYALTDLNNNGTYGIKLGSAGTPGWPQPLRDAPTGIAIANIVPPVSGSDTPEIIVSNFQDSFDINGQYLGDLFSRPYVWDSVGRGLLPFAHSDNPDGAIGVARGHANSSPAVWDVDKNGKPEIFHSAIGTFDPDNTIMCRGSVQRLEATRNTDGTISVLTRTIQATNADGKWQTEPDVTSGDHAAFQVPPVMLRTDINNPDSDRIVAAATVAGDVYGWDKDGNRVFFIQADHIVQSFMVGGNEVVRDRGHLALYNPIVGGDVTGDGRSDLLVATGNYLNYAERDCAADPPEIARWNDGYIYCYSWSTEKGWHQAWRYPAEDIADEYGKMGGYPAFASGVAIGRLLGTGHAPCIVAVDSSGRVVALDGTDGSVLWTFDIPWRSDSPAAPNNKSQHRYTRGSVTQPLILDMNGDGYQDVIVGTTAGWVYFLDGHPAGNQGALLAGHPPQHTVRSADSTTKDGVVEHQYEEVRGLAVGPLKSTPANPTDGATRAILMVTSGRAGLTFPPQVGGHVFLFDLGAGTWPLLENGGLNADWPQFQQNAQRTGHYPGP